MANPLAIQQQRQMLRLDMVPSMLQAMFNCQQTGLMTRVYDFDMFGIHSLGFDIRHKN
jgi:hypothetical protein